MYIFNIIRSIYSVLDKEQKRKMLLLQLFFGLSAIVQVIGIASIAPFIGLLSNPESIQTNKLLSHLYISGNFQSSQSFIFSFALVSIAMIFLSNGVSALTIWLQLKFSIYLGSKLQSRLFSTFISREYLFHKSTNYTKLTSIISADAPRFIYMVLQPYLTICSQAFVGVIILSGLLFLNTAVAIGLSLVIGGAYFATYWIIKKSLLRHGKIVTSRNRATQALLSEAFIGIKDIKLNALESKYSRNYEAAIRKGLDSTAYISLTGDLPRFAIETISFGAILLFALYLLSNDSDSSNVVSILSIYALAGYKLLPTMQQIYKSISSISANGSVVQEIKFNLDIATSTHDHGVVETLSDVEDITLENICYQYPGTSSLALHDVSLTFRKGDLNTIAGPSGSGKSTLADVILGLLPALSGTLSSGKEKIEGHRLFSYQRSIGYVSQNIFILDASVIENVAFGVDKVDVDMDAVKGALFQANAMEFVDKLPEGLNNGLGQDGKLLSGGQRQRIGIARALYRSNKVLILDEPTSALDIESEHDLMQLLNRLKQNVLIIVISHRPAAIKLSDRISVISDGQLIGTGEYTELLANSEYFRSMIEKGFMNP